MGRCLATQGRFPKDHRLNAREERGNPATELDVFSMR